MRYRGKEESTSRRGRRTSSRKGGARRTAVKSSVAGGGSVTPFLRRFYQHKPAVPGPVQRIIFFLVLAGILYAFVLGDSGAIRIAMLRHERGKMDRDIAELRENADKLEKEIVRLKRDAFYIEKVGREKYGYVGEDDKVIKIVPEKKDD